MAVNIDITKKERIYINPYDGQRLSGIQRGVISEKKISANLGSGGDETGDGEGAEEARENQEE